MTQTTTSSSSVPASDPQKLAAIRIKYRALDHKLMTCLKLMRGKRPESGNWWLKNRTWPFTYMGLRLLECVDLADEIADLIKEYGLDLVDLPATNAE